MSSNKCLIISANNNLGTFQATLFAIKNQFELFDSIIRKIIVVRTLAGEKAENSNQYKAICDTIIPKYEEYSEVKIESSQLYLSKLPVMFRNCLSMWHPEDILVDLTNGTKSYTDFIYLACTLLDIKNIFRVFIDKEYYVKQSLDSSYFRFEMESILPQNELRGFVNKTYAEYIYYYSEVNELAKWIEVFIGEQNSHEFFNQMLNAFEKYSNANYKDCIIDLSTLTEHLIKEVLDALKNQFDQECWDWLTGNDSYKRKHSKNSNSRSVSGLGTLAHKLGNILTRANKIISNVEDNATRLPEVSTIRQNPNIYKLAPIIAAGHALQSMAMIRNYNTHGSRYSNQNNTLHDARYQIDVVLYIFHKMSECELLGGTQNVCIS